MCPKVCGQVASPLSATGYHNNKLPSGGDLMEMKKSDVGHNGGGSWRETQGILPQKCSSGQTAN